MRSVEDAVDIEFFIPPMRDKTRHHVISRGQSPDFYRPEDLRDKGHGNTAWVEEFQRIVVGLFWARGKLVPYAFRTPDGSIRSLDAGCIKMMLNRPNPGLLLECNQFGYIDAAQPSEYLLGLYGPMRVSLVKRIHEATAED